MKDRDDIINLDQFRNRKQEEKKRRTERIFFDHLVGVYGMTEPGKMLRIDLTDVSEEGLGIQVPYDSGRNWPSKSDDVTIRMYFSEDSFMEIQVEVKNTRPTIENGSRYVRYGCLVKPAQRTSGAWQRFVQFLRAFAEISEKDSGNVGFGSF